MHVQRIAAFSQGASGGNPAGVVLCDALPPADRMLAIAAEVGYSETVFAAPNADGWRVRYFAPEIEVPFCGHATIALGAALALAHGDGTFTLQLNDTRITVTGWRKESGLMAALQSPRTRSAQAPEALVAAALGLSLPISTRACLPRLPRPARSISSSPWRAGRSWPLCTMTLSKGGG